MNREREMEIIEKIGKSKDLDFLVFGD